MELYTTNRILICICTNVFLLLSISEVQSTSHKLTCSSNTHKLNPGSSLTCKCQVDITRSGNSDAMWERSYGNVRQNIGRNHLIDFKFKNKRYSLFVEKHNTLVAVYKLEIKDLRYYDGVTIQCLSPISKTLTSKNKYTIAVCDKVNSTFCKCMLEKGWASPKCHEEKLEADNHSESLKRACIVIGLLMVLMLIVAIVVTVRMLYRDINSYIEDKRDERLRQLEVQENHTRNAKEPSQSILKRTANQESSNHEPSVINQKIEEIADTKKVLPKDVYTLSNDSDMSYSHKDLEEEPVDITIPRKPAFKQKVNNNLNFNINSSTPNSNLEIASFDNLIQNSKALFQIDNNVKESNDNEQVLSNKRNKKPKRKSDKKKTKSIKKTKKQNQISLNHQNLDDSHEDYNGTEI